jgi:hypothetical protein
MGDLKLNNITPDGVGKIKLGSTNVQKIYNGSTLVFPTSTPIESGQVQLCDLIWTDTNSSETELIAGGNIPIITNNIDWYAAWENNTPAACYVDFDSNNSSFGLLYNIWARGAIKPPTGFRLPTDSDWNGTFLPPCFDGANYNRYGANPGVWDLNLLTDTNELGDTGFNSNGYGYGNLDIFSGPNEVVFTKFGESEAYWIDSPDQFSPGKGFSINSGVLGLSGFGYDTTWCFFMRFVKDA